MNKFIQRQSPARIIALGFAVTLLIGSALLCLPCSVKSGITLRYIDALYTAASAVCVTGLTTVDPGSTFTAFGQVIIALLIQIGGLGLTSVGAGVILAMRKRMNIKERNIIRDAMNLDSGKGIVRFLKSVFLTTVICELIGAALSFVTFARDYPFIKAVGLSLFHSISAFNNAGFDVLGNGTSLMPYKNDVWLNIVTCAIIFFGGIGFLVIRELIEKKLHWKKLSVHSKVVLSTSAALIFAGILLFKLTENISWLGALFQSVSARTAGFCTYPLGGFTDAGLVVMMALMFIGASPGSTGGGIKTTTFFVLLKGVRSAATNESEKAFKYSIPQDAFRKAAIIVIMGISVVLTGIYFMCVMEPEIPLRDIAFEMVSAFGTVGLSTGITGGLCDGSKLLSILIMFIGRLGPLTIATLWHFTNGERAVYPEGNISIG